MSEHRLGKLEGAIEMLTLRVEALERAVAQTRGVAPSMQQGVVMDEFGLREQTEVQP